MMGDILTSWQNHQDDKPPGCRTIWAGTFGSWKFGKPNKNLLQKKWFWTIKNAGLTFNNWDLMMEPSILWSFAVKDYGLTTQEA